MKIFARLLIVFITSNYCIAAQICDETLETLEIEGSGRERMQQSVIIELSQSGTSLACPVNGGVNTIRQKAICKTVFRTLRKYYFEASLILWAGSILFLITDGIVYLRCYPRGGASLCPGVSATMLDTATMTAVILYPASTAAVLFALCCKQP